MTDTAKIIEAVKLWDALRLSGVLYRTALRQVLEQTGVDLNKLGNLGQYRK